MTDSVGVCGALFLPSNRKSDRNVVSHQDLTSLLSSKVNGVGSHPVNAYIGKILRLILRFGEVDALRSARLYNPFGWPTPEGELDGCAGKGLPHDAAEHPDAH